MAYRIEGLSHRSFSHLFGLGVDDLARDGVVRVIATSDRGFPCRVSLVDARKGESLILLNHISHDVGTPYRNAYAIFVREGAEQAAAHVDCVPPVFEGRPLGLRGFDSDGMLKDARLALPGEADARIRELLADPLIESIYAHNAAHGCFVARIERDDQGDAE
ncbi:hypothetical protein GGQ88_001868 [Novosphingobium hassiacum]|uniref:DUF1203 domain-containing protein n=1 Tax=Novosphingobium hassiacum TaxID=173676 RepID=A0A7W5ZYJ1_9SPHN|nr:DUF1203 domain-containing protein [Novosphingobium hassiacum]MBB3860602.1 hypothetical protein [Novosphingobium hassiacum]